MAGNSNDDNGDTNDTTNRNSKHIEQATTATTHRHKHISSSISNDNDNIGYPNSRACCAHEPPGCHPCLRLSSAEVRKLEALVTKHLGEVFEFSSRTRPADERCAADRLKCIGDFVEANCGPKGQWTNRRGAPRSRRGARPQPRQTAPPTNRTPLSTNKLRIPSAAYGRRAHHHACHTLFGGQI